MEKVLMFETSNSLRYWYKYIINYLRENKRIFKAYLYSREIWINGNRIMFKTHIDNTFKIGRRETLYYHNIEKRLSENFQVTLRSILNG